MTSLKNLSDRVLLIILDGFGHNPHDFKNAIMHAQKPNLDYLFNHYPITTIQPGGEAVGLPKGVAGNSEVGHLNLGAGRPVRQDLVRINEAISKNTLKDFPRLLELIQTAHNGNKKIHLMGLLSDGGVHSHIDHLKAIINILKSYPDLKIYLHLFLDGRDTPKTNGVKYLEEMIHFGGAKIASVQGRSIGMDRDRRWEKIQACYEMMVGLKGINPMDPVTYISKSYQENVFDEFINPSLFFEDGKITSDDCIFFFNFRSDRAKQISLCFNDPQFKEFPKSVTPRYFLCMSPFVPDELPDLPILFDKEKISNTLSFYLSTLDKKQFKIAETEKYAHVTYFFNGGEENLFEGEQRTLVASPREVATYDLKPQMSAPEVTQKLLEKLKDKSFTFYAVNFANADMVGHTGNYEAAIKAVEALDKSLKEISDYCLAHNITIVLTADHGNADQMIYEDGGPHTSHSNALVPLVVIHPKLKDKSLELNSEIQERALKDVAPTILYILGLDSPADFIGKNIFK